MARAPQARREAIAGGILVALIVPAGFAVGVRLLRPVDPAGWELALFGFLAILSGIGLGVATRTWLEPRLARIVRNRRRTSLAGLAADRGWSYRETGTPPAPELARLLAPPGLVPVGASEEITGIHRGHRIRVFRLDCAPANSMLTAAAAGAAHPDGRPSPSDGPSTTAGTESLFVGVLSTADELPGFAVCRREDRGRLPKSMATRRIEVGAPDFDHRWLTFAQDAHAVGVMLSPERMDRLSATRLNRCVVFTHGRDLIAIGDPLGGVEVLRRMLGVLATFAE